MIALRLVPAWQAPEVAALYRAASGQSRRPEFYTAGGVPDTIDGRFDLLALHLVLLMLRLRGEGPQGRKMSQHLFDFMGADMDRSLREMGVGDTGIPRRVKAMGEGFYGRYAAYEKGLGDGRDALMTALDKNLYGTVPTAPDSLALMAAYVLRARDTLAGQPLEALLAGKAEFGSF
ncbi:MAG: ubiquinol-cytochrome C chaperone family protein [Alphaproteobacteria bacterium]